MSIQTQRPGPDKVFYVGMAVISFGLVLALSSLIYFNMKANEQAIFALQNISQADQSTLKRKAFKNEDGDLIKVLLAPENEGAKEGIFCSLNQDGDVAPHYAYTKASGRWKERQVPYKKSSVTRSIYKNATAFCAGQFPTKA